MIFKKFFFHYSRISSSYNTNILFYSRKLIFAINYETRVWTIWMSRHICCSTTNGNLLKLCRWSFKIAGVLAPLPCLPPNLDHNRDPFAGIYRRFGCISLVLSVQVTVVHVDFIIREKKNRHQFWCPSDNTW